MHTRWRHCCSAGLLGGCSIGVPDPAAPRFTCHQGVATPTITPGHDAGAVAARDMPFSAGARWPEVFRWGSPRTFEARSWTQLTSNAGGASRYRNPTAAWFQPGCARTSRPWSRRMTGSRQSAVHLPGPHHPSAYLSRHRCGGAASLKIRAAGLGGVGPGRTRPAAGPKPGRATAVLARVFGTRARPST